MLQKHLCAFIYISDQDTIPKMQAKLRPWLMLYEPPVGSMPSIMMVKKRSPTILVVSDEIFNFSNQQLERRCSEILQKQNEKMPACIFASLFDGRNEPREIQLYQYLMRPGLLIVSFKMVEKLLEFWNSQKIQWHLERGLKVNDRGEWLNDRKERAVSLEMISMMSTYMLKRFSEMLRPSMFCISSFIPISQRREEDSGKPLKGEKGFHHEAH